ncbi:MAG TPA: response regulator [Ktedonobacterales bacterium]
MALNHISWGPGVEPRMRVLVVESSLSARESVAQALANHCALTFAGGQHEALALISSERPDLVVTEVDLEEGDGISLCVDIRRGPQTERLPLMLLSGRASVQDRVAGYSAGADDYVVKPFDSRLLHARLRLLARIKGLQFKGA